MSAATMRDAFERAEMNTIWSVPDLTVLSAGRRPPVPMPSDLFGPAWGLLKAIGVGVGAPVDYAAIGFIANCASLIGGKRKVRPYTTSNWAEPCILWIGAVGGPSSGKSPALDAVTKPLRELETDHAEHHKLELREFKECDELAKASRKHWQDAVSKAAKDGVEPPRMPDEAVEPVAPARRRTLVMDGTPESVACILQGNPQGTLHFRDELAGWFNTFDRYNGSGGREFWLEAFGGRPYVVDRKSKTDGPLLVAFNGVSVSGGIQPEKLADALFSSPDDGLVARFLWAWPDKLPYAGRPKVLADEAALESLYRRLDSLPWSVDSRGGQAALTLNLTGAAADIFEEWERENSLLDEHAPTLFKSFVGKMNGMVLRLALVSEYIRWAWNGGPEPQFVSEASLIAAATFVDDYAKPMAERVYGDSAVPEAERNASVLAGYIRKANLRTINKRDLKRSPHKSHLPRLRGAQALDAAVDILVDAGWLMPNPSREGGGAGREKQDFLVNPAVLGDS